MASKTVNYSLVDAFAESAFKGNPAAVCLLDEDPGDEWMKSVAREFNISETCYLTRISHTHLDASLNPRFHLRWFTPVEEVVLSSAKVVADFLPQLDKIKKCTERALIITGAAPPGSGYDFFSRFFAPKLGVDEDPVTGSAHCALAPYWCKKLGKVDFTAYQASRRGGTLHLHLDEKNHRVLLRGKAVTVMKGSILV